MPRIAIRLLLATALLAMGAPARGDEALDQLNIAARAAYADGRAALIARTSPIIVVAFDELVLHRDGAEKRETFTPRIYHELKSASHLPLGIVGLLAAETPGAREGAWRTRLAELGARARSADPAIDKLDLSAAQKTRLHRIMADSLAVIDRTLASGVPSEAALAEYTHAMAPLLLATADDAARAQIDGLHALAQRWRKDMSPEEWQRLFVVVLGPKLPRAGNLQYAYFVEALGPGSADRRVIYAEGIFDEKQAIALLATIVTDRRAGLAFFDDQTRMERDFLADAARAYLLRLFGRLGAD